MTRQPSATRRKKSANESPSLRIRSVSAGTTNVRVGSACTPDEHLIERVEGLNHDEHSGPSQPDLSQRLYAAACHVTHRPDLRRALLTAVPPITLATLEQRGDNRRVGVDETRVVDTVRLFGPARAGEVSAAALRVVAFNPFAVHDRLLTPPAVETAGQRADQLCELR